VARIFTPGAPTSEIVDWVHEALGEEDVTAPGGVRPGA
jgi:hypothetical protein